MIGSLVLGCVTWEGILLEVLHDGKSVTAGYVMM